MRLVIAIFIVYTGLLILFLGLRQYQLTASINDRIADDTTRLIDTNPVDHKQTLFSGMLLEQVTTTSQHYTNTWFRTVPRFELVTMRPCNPRIQRCG